jgi:hypothetical protein
MNPIESDPIELQTYRSPASPITDILVTESMTEAVIIRLTCNA